MDREKNHDYDVISMSIILSSNCLNDKSSLQK